jgi:tetrahydromethanopterin S-methyltransferase subunit H
VKGKMDILEIGGTGQAKGMLEVAKDCGITRPIVDVAAMPPGAGAGATVRSIMAVKGHLGLPKDQADDLWHTQQEMGDVTGVPYINQIVGETPEAIIKFIDWFVDIDDKTAFLIDSSAGDVRAAAAKYCTEIGVADRAIHNSINASVNEEEIAAVTESDLDAAIVLAFNATDPSVKGKMDILEIGGTGQAKGMLDVAKDCGITRPIVDVAAMPPGSGAGATVRSIMAVKGHLGLPTGGGFHNMASAWDWLKKFKKEHKEAYMPADIGTNLVCQVVGADCLLYGPIENVRSVFPAVALVDIMLAETAKDLGSLHARGYWNPPCMPGSWRRLPAVRSY